MLQTAKASTQKLFTGTSGWAYPTWKPDFYPKTVPSKKFLEYYATQLNSVEVNYTFRALPTAQQLENWLSATLEGFRFSFKAPQAITHFKRLKDCGDAVALFLDALIPVRTANRTGAVLFQLPPNFKADAARLRDFLALPAFDGSPQIAFEFRHESWFCEEIYSILSGKNVAVCIAENEDLVTPETFTADFSCYRLRMPGGYNASEIATFAKKFAEMSKQREIYVYFKHEDEPTGPLAATRMLQEARAL
ncbi:MAG: DUF72 domain-containing protein [Acidobacteria bacterium]|nr:DUF72 domain-containing protein [Acidobacteriota bacterium]